MFGIPITSWEKLVSEFAQELDMSNFESRPYVDLTDQRTGTHVNSMYGDPTCEEGLNGHELVEIEPKDSHEGYELMEQFAQSRPEAEADKLFQALNRRHPFSTFRYAVEDLGILQEWYDFKNKALEELAEERLRDCGIEFKDGKIVCTKPELISVFECETDEDDLDEEEDDEETEEDETDSERQASLTDDAGTKVEKQEVRISRNAPCPCGSGKKYKKCCGAKIVAEERAAAEKKSPFWTPEGVTKEPDDTEAKWPNGRPKWRMAIDAANEREVDRILDTLVYPYFDRHCGMTDFEKDERFEIAVLEAFGTRQQQLGTSPSVMLARYDQLWDILREKIEAALDWCETDGESSCEIRWDRSFGGPILSVIDGDAVASFFIAKPDHWGCEKKE